MAAETAEPRKRRKYTIEDRKEILAVVDAVGVVEAVRRHGVPQTTVSKRLHRDAAKVAKERPAKQEVAKPVVGRGEEDASTVQQRRRARTTRSRPTTSPIKTAARKPETAENQWWDRGPESGPNPS
jgi:hypothetical protein